LRSEGYDIEVVEPAYLLLKDVPYVNAAREVKRGTLVSALTMAGNVTVAPDHHVVYFIGEFPCEASGTAMETLRCGGQQQLSPNLTADHQFSRKLPNQQQYPDYYAKMTAYVALLQAEAQAIDPSATARTFPVIRDDEPGSVFKYWDTATGRAGTGAVNSKLDGHRVGIVGLGGTGAYVLDLVAKTPVRQIHLFDGDPFLTHNAFRAPGAASLDELGARPSKVGYLSEQYSRMRDGIIPHDYFLDAATLGDLSGLDFVFLCVDSGDARKLIADKLEELDIAFVDTGVGIQMVRDSLCGIVRATASLPGKRNSLPNRASLSDVGRDDEYEQNIQIADLNCLNAVMAVIRWKKLCGFYHDFQQELHSSYTVVSNVMDSEDCL
jgi:hypothetical protein